MDKPVFYSTNPLQAIEFEINEIYRQQGELMNRLAALMNAKKLLEDVYQPLKPIPTIEQFVEASADIGITDAVRGALRMNADRGLTPTQIRDIVASHGFDLSKYKNAMAAIHQVISRLVESKDVRQITQDDEKAFQWAGKISIANLMMDAPKPSVKDLAAGIMPPPTSMFQKLGEAVEEAKKKASVPRPGSVEDLASKAAEKFRAGPEKKK